MSGRKGSAYQSIGCLRPDFEQSLSSTGEVQSHGKNKFLHRRIRAKQNTKISQKSKTIPCEKLALLYILWLALFPSIVGNVFDISLWSHYGLYWQFFTNLHVGKFKLALKWHLSCQTRSRVTRRSGFGSYLFLENLIHYQLMPDLTMSSFTLV